MKPFWKFVNLLTFIFLIVFLGMRDVFPARADAPFQIITVLTHAPSTAGDGESFIVAATADSGLDVTYSASGVCTNVGATFTMTSNSGICTVQYDQSGDSNYDPAPQVTENVTAQDAVTATPTNTQTATPTATATSTTTPTGTNTATSTLTATPTAMATPLPPAFYVSTTGSDANTCASPSDPCLTINAAIDKANTWDTIKVAVGTYTNVQIEKNIFLLGGWNANFTQQNGRSTVNGQASISIWNGSTTTIEKFVITNGSSGVFNYSGNLTLNDVLITNNQKSTSDGAGISNNGILMLKNSVVTGNKVSGGFGGGGIDNNYKITIQNSVISYNEGAYGGGIASNGNLTIINSTITGNISRESGGGISSSGANTIRNSTISENKAGSVGGGIQGFGIRLSNTILANNIALSQGPDCSGSITSNGYNLIGNTSSCTVNTPNGDLLNKDPKLGTFLGNDRGYYPLLPGSPAINKGNPAIPESEENACIATDQRGVTRPIGIRCDIGSYEYMTPKTVSYIYIIAGTNQKAAPRVKFSNPLQVVVIDNQGNPIPGIAVTFTAPASGASGKLGNTGTHIQTITTDISGIASTTVTANAQLGSYIISVTAAGAAPVNFEMTNFSWFVSTSGNNANSCTSPSAACLTINGALQKAKAGDTILVAQGIYTGTNTNVVSITKSIIISGGWNANFTAQVGTSTIDGENKRRGISLDANNVAFPVTIETFTIRNGRSNAGAGIYNIGSNLTINNLTITNNVATGDGGGILNYGNLTINDTTIIQNTGGQPGTSGASGGGGISHHDGLLIVNHSSIHMNLLVGGYYGSGIYSNSIAILNNSTVSNNIGQQGATGMIHTSNGSLTLNNSTVTNTTQKAGIGISKSTGNIEINNSTITNTQLGIVYDTAYGGKVTLRNSILSQNTTDCQGKITSLGYNLIGNTTGCTFTKSTGDITNPNPKLGQMTGFPGYIPLLPGSPAINTGNASTCLSTDQRGLKRPQGNRCDMGSYEYKVPGPASALGIVEGNYQMGLSGGNFSNLLKAYVVDQWGSPVQGVKVIFTTPTSGASAKFGTSNTTSAITDINGIATASTLKANNQPGSYTIRVAASGLTNSPTTFALTNLPVPMALSPQSPISDPTPAYQWTKVIGATQYQIELRSDGWDILYTKTVSASACGATSCSTTPPNQLQLTSSPHYYQWRVRALVGSTWQAFSPYKIFKVSIHSGFWAGTGVGFYVTPDRKSVTNPTIYLNVTGCGLYSLTSTLSTSLAYDVQFALYTPSFNIAGSFNTITRVYGSTYYFANIPNCGYVEGSFDWQAYWVDDSSPSATDIQTITVTPSAKPQKPHIPDDTFKIEPLTP